MTAPSPKVIQHLLEIRSGALGPVGPCKLEIRPLTVFVGPQGSGKSLMAQLLYFFEELPYLVTLADAMFDLEGQSPVEVVRRILDQLRSHERAFATFANPAFRTTYKRGLMFRIDGKDFSGQFAIWAYRNNRVVRPDPKLRAFVAAVRAAKSRPLNRAVFFPTERLVISQLRRAIAEKVLALPITYTIFSDWIDRASSVLGTRPDELSSPEARWIAERGELALRGHAERRGRQWKWRWGRQKGQIFDLDMASSGQRANWSLFSLPQALFELRKSRAVMSALTVFVEEPEIHLHPSGQQAVAEVLAFLVNRGFRVVVTTHSPSVLATLNNLVQASRLGDGEIASVPEPAVRLKPELVSVYAFGGEAPRSIVDDTGFIDEGELGKVAESLAGDMNAIAARLPPAEV